MSSARYTCCQENRRAAVDADSTLNGIDWLEVLDLDAPADSPRQQTLMVRLLKPVPADITEANLSISGGERIRNIGILWAAAADSPPAEATPDEVDFFTNLPDADNVLLVRTDSAGDFSSYQLRLSKGKKNPAPLANFDPRLSAIDFCFKVECPSEFDCAAAKSCTNEAPAEPDLNYLARDYASLRRQIIDRMSQQMPGWRDRSPADLATTLAELIAYIGDLKHYQLDAITSEAYLHSARRRTSLRRHALLVDYRINEGCNARSWLHLAVSGTDFELPNDARFFTRVRALPTRITPASPEEAAARQAKALVFEPIREPPDAPIRLLADHNQFDFYTWGDNHCCLPTGATRATLLGHWPELARGDVLIFEEIVGPQTGVAEDADPSHRHAVRLTRVEAFSQNVGEEASPSPLVDPLADPDTAQLTEITEIEWHTDDALPFPLCISTDAVEGNVSVALGNNILVDHGETLSGELLGEVPSPRLHYPAAGTDSCQPSEPTPIPPRFNPQLAKGPVTRQGKVIQHYSENGISRSKRVSVNTDHSASAAMQWLSTDAVPIVTLEETNGITNSTSSEHWKVMPDLLSSHGSDRHFVVETEDDGTTKLRFGDDIHGRRPDTGTDFIASYRVGNGPQGNVGADSIAHILTGDGRIDSVRNPLPAKGGSAPETKAQIRRRAPHAFRTQERAVTPTDYAAITARLVGVQRATASLRWTGSWHSVFTTVDRTGGEPVSENYANSVVAHLNRYRMAGHDLKVTNPQYVPLEIDIEICVDPDYLRSDVKTGLLDVLGSQIRSDGRLGLFHPDNFSFGQTIYLSPLYAAARTVAGVASLQVTRFHPQGHEDPIPLSQGFMMLSRLQIARLDNDPNFPEHGVLRLNLHGGK